MSNVTTDIWEVEFFSISQAPEKYLQQLLEPENKFYKDRREEARMLASEWEGSGGRGASGPLQQTLS